MQNLHIRSKAKPKLRVNTKTPGFIVHTAPSLILDTWGKTCSQFLFKITLFKNSKIFFVNWQEKKNVQNLHIRSKAKPKLRVNTKTPGFIVHTAPSLILDTWGKTCSQFYYSYMSGKTCSQFLFKITLFKNPKFVCQLARKEKFAQYESSQQTKAQVTCEYYNPGFIVHTTQNLM